MNPGIGLVLYGNQQQLKYVFAVSPCADPRAIPGGALQLSNEVETE